MRVPKTASEGNLLMEYELKRVTRKLSLADAPNVTGTTSGLRQRTIAPTEVTFTASARRTTAQLTGYAVNSKGEVSKSWATVSVVLDDADNSPMYAEAPLWVHNLYAELRRA